MNNNRKFIFGCMVLGCSQHALALATCNLNGPAANFTANLTPASITVGPDIPNGTVIYRLDFKSPGAPPIPQLTCGPAPYTSPETLKYSSNPLPLASWSGSPFPGQVYQTQVPGIGVVLWSDLNNQALPTIPYTTYRTGTLYWNAYPRINVVLSLIKIGPVAPGSINGSMLPTVQSDMGSDPTLTNPPLRMYNLQYIGSLNIVSQTCTTPDVNVMMGQYETSKSFKGIGSVTPWIDASITLTGCPAFYGYYNNSSPNVSSGSSGLSTVGLSVKNILNVQLNPTYTILDAPNGIIAISSTASAATGIGLQLGWGAAGTPPKLVNLSTNSYDFSPTNTGGGTMKIPLSARYYQTKAVVTPGRADSKLTFTINYY
ncbi:fimbrial protein [Yersinia intermedia]|uniref:fimbrial protein n=1 Tax=Yersinia intermedia TaxID=631 RepID=UPI00117F09F2|nr:fimbrial protein [Yersinia intermedia]